MVITRSTVPAVTQLNPAQSDGGDQQVMSTEVNPSPSPISPQRQRTGVTEAKLEERPGIRDIVEAIVQAFTDKRLVEERLAPALAPVLAPALHSCFMMELEKRDAQIKRLEANLSTTEARLEDLEQYSRRNCLIIHGIEETTGESTDDLICSVAKEELDVTILPEHIDRSHRIGQRGRKDQRGRPLHRPIVAKFATYGPRSRIYAARSKLQKSTKRIFIHENLTSDRQKLLKNVKSKYTSPEHKVWTQDAKIKIRTNQNRLYTIASKTDWKEHCQHN